MVEVKKNHVAAKQSFSFKKAQNFVGDLKGELAKVSWTSPEELRSYTKIVVGATFFLGMGIYFVDVLIQIGLSGLQGFIRLIGG